MIIEFLPRGTFWTAAQGEGKQACMILWLS